MPLSRNRLSGSSLARDEAPSAPEGERAVLPAPLRDKVFGVLVSAVTFHEEEILLLRRSLEQRFMPGAWSIPAGKIQPCEISLEEAALRELYEEAGIHGTVQRNLGMCWFESTYYDQQIHHIQFNFAVQAPSKKVELRDGSNMEYQWVPISELEDPPVPIDDFTRRVIDQASSRISQQNVGTDLDPGEPFAES